MAGAGTKQAQEALRVRLRLLQPALASVPIHVVHDGITAFEGAFGGNSGLLVIAGTGSVIYGRTFNGAAIRAGGWGYLLGDEGSGYAIGVRGLRAVCRAYDGESDTLLVQMLAQLEGIDRASALLHRVYQDGWPIQNMAPLVLKAAANGDVLAGACVDKEVTALVARVANLIRRSEKIEPRLAVHGGLANSAYYLNTFKRTLDNTLPSWTLFEPESDALEGALRLAQRED